MKNVNMDEIKFENQLGFVLPVKNESEYIGEWLEYNYAMGVDKFYIYNNESEDRSELLKVLEPWIQKKIVDFEDYPGKKVQLAVYDDAIYRHRFDCKYMGFLDADEFIYIKQDKTILEFMEEFLSAYETSAGFVMTWRCFGTGGQKKKLSGGVIDRFVTRGDADFKANRYTKTIINPRRIRGVYNPHYAKFLPDTVCLNEFGQINVDMNHNSGRVDQVQVNHYMTKSVEEYTRKRSRGRADSLEKHLKEEFPLYDQNHITDTGLREKWHAMQKNPRMLRVDSADPSRHDEKLILANILDMLAPILNEDLSPENYFGHIEKFITCFGLIRKCGIISETERDFLENASLRAIDLSIQSGGCRIYNIFLLMHMMAELMSSRSELGWKIVRKCEDLIPRMDSYLKTAGRMEDYVDMFFWQRLLKNIPGRGEFNFE